MTTSADLFALIESRGSGRYGLSAVSQLEHALRREARNLGLGIEQTQGKRGRAVLQAIGARQLPRDCQTCGAPSRCNHQEALRDFVLVPRGDPSYIFRQSLQTVNSKPECVHPDEKTNLYKILGHFL